jgi:hypothetical protein
MTKQRYTLVLLQHTKTALRNVGFSSMRECIEHNVWQCTSEIASTEELLQIAGHLKIIKPLCVACGIVEETEEPLTFDLDLRLKSKLEILYPGVSVSEVIRICLEYSTISVEGHEDALKQRLILTLSEY